MTRKPGQGCPRVTTDKDDCYLSIKRCLTGMLQLSTFRDFYAKTGRRILRITASQKLHDRRQFVSDFTTLRRLKPCHSENTNVIL